MFADIPTHNLLMARGKELSVAKCAQIMVLHQQNFSKKRISAILGVSRSAVIKGIARATELGTLDSRKRSGRPRVTSLSADRLIRRACIAHPTWSSSAISSSMSDPPSSRTIRRRLVNDFNLRCYRAAKKAKLTAKNIKDRLAF